MSERFCQTASRRKIENAKQSSPWKGNSGKVIDFFLFISEIGHRGVQGNGAS
jgi:hypothetical protein